MRIVRHVVTATLLVTAGYLTAFAQAVDCRPEALELSIRHRQMPNVVGCSFDPVNSMLRRYNPRKIVVAGSQPDGQVVTQSPHPGEPLLPGTMVELTVSDGTESQVSDVVPLADLSVTGTVDHGEPYRPGDMIKFSMYVNNAGPTLATGILINEVPTNLTIQQIYGACTAFPCSIVNLGPQSTASIFMTALIAGEGNFNNAVDAALSERDPNPSNNRVELGGHAEAIRIVNLSADIEVTGSLKTSDSPRPGTFVGFSIRVRNAGPGVARGVRVSQVPTNVEVQQFSGDCVVPCDLDPGATTFIYMSGVIVREGGFQDSVSVSYEGQDPDLQNNRVDLPGSTKAPTPRMYWTWCLLAVTGLLGAFAVFTRKLRRARWRSKTTVSVSLQKGDVVGASEPISFAAPPIQLRTTLELGNAAPDGRVLIIREEVLDD